MSDSPPTLGGHCSPQPRLGSREAGGSSGAVDAAFVLAVVALLGPLLLGLRVANTIATIVEVPAAQTVEVVGAALTAAVT